MREIPAIPLQPDICGEYLARLTVYANMGNTIRRDPRSIRAAILGDSASRRVVAELGGLCFTYIGQTWSGDPGIVDPSMLLNPASKFTGVIRSAARAMNHFEELSCVEIKVVQFLPVLGIFLTDASFFFIIFRNISKGNQIRVSESVFISLRDL